MTDRDDDEADDEFIDDHVDDGLDDDVEEDDLPEDGFEDDGDESGEDGRAAYADASHAADDGLADEEGPRPLLAATRISLTFGRQEVLRGIDLTVPVGQTVVVIGESGCGKTMLLKTLIGLVRPTTGRVVFDGHDLATLPASALAKVRARYGFVFQQAALFDSLTVGQNVAFPLREQTGHGRTRREIRDIVRQRIREVGLPESVIAKKPVQLSGGQRKRIGLARALVLDPDVLLYDEPTTGLDPIMTDVINELILSIHRDHTVTGVLVTHDMTSVRKVADRVVMLYPLSRLEPGEPQVLYDGPPEGLEDADDPRVRQFVRGEAGERLRELRA